MDKISEHSDKELQRHLGNIEQVFTTLQEIERTTLNEQQQQHYDAIIQDAVTLNLPLLQEHARRKSYTRTEQLLHSIRKERENTMGKSEKEPQKQVRDVKPVPAGMQENEGEQPQQKKPLASFSLDMPLGEEYARWRQLQRGREQAKEKP